MVYYISDTHFDHENVIKFCNRPFTTVEEMNMCIINNWNGRVSNRDIVYILGDMFYRTENPHRILNILHGRKTLIEGNHDRSWLKYIEPSKYFQDVIPMLEISTGSCLATLCHYPMMSWRRKMKAYMIHGHIHNNTTENDFWYYIKSSCNILNAGVDINQFKPVTFEELIENNRVFKSLH